MSSGLYFGRFHKPISEPEKELPKDTRAKETAQQVVARVAGKSLEPRICSYCSNQFQPKDNRNKHCSTDCYTAHVALNARKRACEGLMAGGVKHATCLHCTKRLRYDFAVKGRKYCSATCSAAAAKLKEVHRPLGRPPLPVKPDFRVPGRICYHCDGTIRVKEPFRGIYGRLYCSSLCKQAAEVRGIASRGARK